MNQPDLIQLARNFVAYAEKVEYDPQKLIDVHIAFWEHLGASTSKAGEKQVTTILNILNSVKQSMQ